MNDPVNIEAVLAAHDALHKDDIGTAHECLHKALGVDNDTPLPIAPLAHIRGFEQAFATACRKNGIQAAYILIDPHAPKRTDGSVRLLKGGNADLSRILDRLR